ncbi:hypothetical protein BCU48_024455, partial [Vibrio splendidus]|uniref:hypothetical protein n=1 Tax=Vibrio splendidus TaxID=29497 RepID=UPI0039A4E1A1
MQPKAIKPTTLRLNPARAKPGYQGTETPDISRTIWSIPWGLSYCGFVAVVVRILLENAKAFHDKCENASNRTLYIG